MKELANFNSVSGNSVVLYAYTTPVNGYNYQLLVSFKSGTIFHYDFYNEDKSYESFLDHVKVFT